MAGQPLCPECRYGLVMDWKKDLWFCHRCGGHAWKDQGGVHVGGKGGFSASSCRSATAAEVAYQAAQAKAHAHVG